VRVPSLLEEDRSHAALPHFLDRFQDAELVVDHHVMMRRIHALDVGKHLFFVDEDQHPTAEGLPQA